MILKQLRGNLPTVLTFMSTLRLSAHAPSRNRSKQDSGQKGCPNQKPSFRTPDRIHDAKNEARRANFMFIRRSFVLHTPCMCCSPCRRSDGSHLTCSKLRLLNGYKRLTFLDVCGGHLRFMETKIATVTVSHFR